MPLVTLTAAIVIIFILVVALVDRLNAISWGGASMRGRSVRSLVSIDRKFRGSQLASDGKRERESADCCCI